LNESYNIDNTAPVISNPVIADGSVVNIVEESNGVEVSVTVTGAPTSVTIGGVTASNTSGDTWAATIPPNNVTVSPTANGSNSYIVTAIDAAGNSASETYSYDADLTAPDAPFITALTNDTGTDGTDALANNATNGLSGTSNAADGATIAIFLSTDDVSTATPQATATVSTSVMADQTGPLQVGEVITFTVDFGEDVSVGATEPVLDLTGSRTATLDMAASDSDTLVFTYTVGDPDNVVDLDVLGYTGDITDAAGNDAVISATDLNIILDTETPQITAAALLDTVTENDAGYLGLFQAALPDDGVGDGVGKLTWTFDVTNAGQQATIQSLGQGETLTQTYTVTLTDEDNNSVPQTVVITIEGTNDAPVIDGAIVGTNGLELTEGNSGQSATLL